VVYAVTTSSCASGKVCDVGDSVFYTPVNCEYSGGACIEQAGTTVKHTCTESACKVGGYEQSCVSTEPVWDWIPPLGLVPTCEYEYTTASVGCCEDAPTCTGCSCTPTCGGSYPLGSCSGPGCTSGQRCCTNVDSCGVACGGQTCKTCYVCNPPVVPATPTTVSLRINTTDYTLSTSSSSPTMIDYRNGGTIKVFSNAVSNSTTDYYKYNVYNAYTGGTSLLDYAGTTQIQPPSGSLTSSLTGRFEASHYNLKCPDNSRNYSGIKIGYYCLETYAPSVSATNASAQWFNTQRTAVVSSTQDMGCSTLAHTRYKWGSDFTNSNCDSTSGGTQTSNGASLNVPSGGTTLYLCSRNTAGIVSTWSGTYRWENTLPSVSASNSSSSWFNYQRTATVSASDTGGSGLAQVRYNWGVSSTLTADCTSGGTITSNGAVLSSPAWGTKLWLCARDNAGNVKTWSGTYNWCTPTVPQNPTDIFINYQGGSYTGLFPLSGNLASPTRLPVLHDDQTGTLYLPEQTPPTCMIDYGYIYETSDGGDGTYIAPNYIHTYNPQDALRNQGDAGDAKGRYYNHSMAGTLMLSNWKQGYYKVNNNPVFGCPGIDIETDKTSTRNCISTTYTGTEVNNPLKFEITGSDSDGGTEIKGAIVWLSKNGTISEIPDAPIISSFYTRSDPNHIAVMIKQKDGSWANPPLLYAPDATNGYNWGNITSHKEIRIKDGTQTVVMAKVGSVNVTVNGGNVNFNVELIFNEVASDRTVYPEGNYDVSGLVFDQYMLLGNGTVVDQYFMSTECRSGGWNIDLRRPLFATDSPTTETIYSRVLKLLWSFNGTGSYATDAVINAYSYTETEDVILETPTGYSNITLSPPPPEAEIGVIGDNAWDIKNSPLSGTYDSNARINIGTNDDGTITFYVTGFDQACNYVVSDGSDTTINLNPWITSKGGLMYSGGDVGAHAKDYYTGSPYVDFINSVLRKVDANELDIATEAVTSRSDNIREFVQGEFQSSAVRASGVSNSNSQTSSWYEYFSNRLNEQMVELGQSNFRLFGFPAEKLTSTKISDYCVTPFLPQAEREYCYMNIQGDLHVVPSSQLTCDKKTLIMASGDIYIEPDIINGGDTNIDGCLFVAGGSIYVGAGVWKTGNATGIEETKYDYLDAYLVADDIIDLQLVDVHDSLGGVIYTRDGLEMYGGLVAFGENIPTGTSAVQVNRSFGLWNAYIPVTAITWDPRYAKLAEAFFGSTSGIYKREVGFKPY